MKYFAIFIAALTMAACSSAPSQPPVSQGAQQPQIIVVVQQPAPNTVLPTTPVGTYYIPVPAAKVYQNPAYIRVY